MSVSTGTTSSGKARTRVTTHARNRDKIHDGTFRIGDLDGCDFAVITEAAAILRCDPRRPPPLRRRHHPLHLPRRRVPDPGPLAVPADRGGGVRAPSPPAPPQWETPRIGAVPHFEGGRWNAGTDWIDSRWVVGPGTARLGSPAVRGYSREACVSLGTEFGPRIRLWERDPGVTDVPPFLILAASEVSCHYVSAGSFGDAMDLASRWAQAVTAEVLSTTYQELTDG
jgi:hypothetical protein